MTETEPRAIPGPWHYVVLLAAQVAVGSAAIMARGGLDGGLDPLSLSAWRLGIAASIAVLAAYLSRERAPTSSSPMSTGTAIRLCIAGVCLAIHFAAWFASLQRISVARSTLLVTTAPVWAGLAGCLFLRTRLSSRFWLGLAIAAGGLTLFVGEAARGAAGSVLAGSVAGDLLAILGAVAVAAYLLLVEDLQKPLGTWRTVSWTYASAAVSVAACAVAFAPQGHRVPQAGAVWGAVLALALVPQLIGHTALNWSLKRFASGIVAAATLLEPVIAAGLAWSWFGEAVSVRQMIGGLIVLVGVGVTLCKPSARRMEA